ncbi:outer membrane beta-barrel family protein [Parabacteroides sp. PF5-9]|uniref:outer membrane beta-barrel family protein n=1 Tax=Parabacteroides sp. PF5-9 TaxID=1742404 RepID=UPI002473A46E|nr:outer membrane beta-barrel family protein [Parabacteroides sp. PF5-9]MDH6359171.1 hypothetical protein [Parabacteroides sp. PF5-9]
MNRFYYILCILLLGNTISSYAQSIRGVVTDSQQQPIDGVAIILQTTDSLFIDAIVSDTLGQFQFSQTTDQAYRLLFQHILYETKQLDVASAEIGVVQLASKDYLLDEITVKGERPQVRVENGKLSYDVPQLIKNKTVTNAFEVIKELPGVMPREESIQLVGTGNLHIIINGQLTGMSLDQLIQLLKSMPADRVKKAEVMYNAPARYNVKGALINIILEDNPTDTPSIQGEAGVDYTQKHYAAGDAHLNLLYSSPRLNIDFLADGGKWRGFGGEEIQARHTLNNKVTEIHQDGRMSSDARRGTMRVGMDYTFANEDKLSGSYYINADKTDYKRGAQTIFTPENNPATTNESLSKGSETSALHNARLQYNSHKGLMAGIDYTGYHSPDDRHFLDKSNTGDQIDMQTTSKQDIARWTAFMNHTYTFKSGLSLNYGLNGGYTSSDNYIEYAYNKGNGYIPAPELTEDNTQKEYSGNVFAEVSHRFGSHFSATIGLKTEYFKSEYTSPDEKRTLWDEWAFFPTASLNYMFSPLHILQFNLSSDKTYPGYWSLSPQSVPLNSYSEVVGNPELKPSRSYEGQLVYIFKQKYTFLLFCEYEPDYFVQLPYQSENELKNVFRYENIDYSMKTGFAAIIPFRVGSFWDSRITANVFRMQEKSDHFHNMTFNQKGTVGAFFMNNTFNLSNRPNLKLTIDGQYVTSGATQGVYDLGSLYTVSAGLKWTFLEERASLTLNANDIFRSGYPTAKVNIENQWSQLNKLNDLSYVKLSFVYKFGGYKEKRHDKVDTSRFGQ